ncbi:SURF1 family protein [Cognatiluteimonas weifangensis]|uniref:SURF1-like protein n=1 Tax=Cognatiluteimonas weifangensis TaxID=2303539 RepID=A0A372DHR2_9GAMM|nr:SURF1 family protein [Luteimonas weifangensis]RFP59110.1 SURF1 family protein [Luteimonas weifangensis]
MSVCRNIVFGWALALLAIALFTRLGLWQLQRMQQKQAMLAAVAGVLQARQPQPLAVAADPQRRAGYDWSAGRGHFLAAPAVLLDNQSREERAGVRAYRVFQPAVGTPLLVELGWLPLPGDRRLPAVPRPAGEWQLAGLLTPPPAAGLGGGAALARADGALLTLALDPPTLRRALDLPALAPRVLKLDPAQALDAGPGYVRDLDILPNTLPPERHLGYAVQWFALAAAVLVTALVLSLRRHGARARRAGMR